MPIVIEEMTGEIVPPESREAPRGESGTRPQREAELRHRIRRLSAREARLEQRLCDR